MYWGLSRTKEFAKVYNLCLSSPVSCGGGFSHPFFRSEYFIEEIILRAVGDVAAIAAAWTPDIARHRYQNEESSPPTMIHKHHNLFHICLESGGGASCKSLIKWCRPSSTDLTRIPIPSRVYLIDTGNEGRARDSRHPPPPPSTRRSISH